jgi:hypothetical protein
VRGWIDAYAESRDDDLVALAHPEVVLHPRRGQGEREYRGIDGVRRWLAAAGSPRPRLSVVAIAERAESPRSTSTSPIGRCSSTWRESGAILRPPGPE